MRIDSLNIGGGPHFNEPGWLNLEEVTGPLNPHSFKLTPSCTFPLENMSIKTVYASHSLEHLDNMTVSRVLKEVHRVLKNDGRFIIKIPDFDKALDCWRRRDESFFDTGYDRIVDTWKNRKIKDCVDYRAAVLFCGFWNDEYGDHYSEKITKNEYAYHGPPVISINYLRDLIIDHTPSEISAKLSRIVIENEKNYHFNHRNSWSRNELKKLLNSFDFKVVSFDKDLILSESQDIPDINHIEKISLYCWARKRDETN